MSRETPPEPQFVVKQFRDSNEIDRAIAKLRRRIDDVKGLDPDHHHYGGQEKENVEQSIRKTILAVFGGKSPEYVANEGFSIWRGRHILGDGEHERQRKFADGIPRAITMLEGLIKHLEEEKADFIPPEPERHSDTQPNQASPVYVNIHGNVATVALGDATQNVTIVAFLDGLIKQIETADIPSAEKKTITDRLRDLSNNPWIQNLGSQAIIEVLRTIAAP
ncbi:MAG: hypothetical protein JXB13_23005 [Phycisphaerae bacterium]|nr:hypothetical protein [Phycisphaerae bacterium]